MKQALAIFEKANEEGKKIQTKLQNQIARVMQRNMPTDRFLALALREISESDKLMQCSALSVCASIVEAAIMGLEISSVTGQAYLVPFKQTCQLIVGYKGLILLAWRDAKIITHADLIREADSYDIIRGSHPSIIHRPAINCDRGNVVGAYAIFTYPDGRTVQVFHDHQELERRRLRSRAKDNGPWITDKSAMQMKCPIRDGGSKFIPFDTAPMLVTAAARDELREGGIGGYVEPIAAEAAGEITGEDPALLKADEEAEAKARANRNGKESVRDKILNNKPDPTITPAQAKALDQKASDSGFKPMEWSTAISQKFQVGHTDKILASQFDAAMTLASGG